jgi:hypothetical protein
MSEPIGDVDPFISERIVEIRNRFGIAGLRAAAEMIELEAAIFGRAADELTDTVSGD